MRAALAAVCAEVRVRSVEDGGFVLDCMPVDEWRRVGLGLEVGATAPTENVSASGVPE